MDADVATDAVVDRARPRIVDALRSHGVIGVLAFVAFHGEPVLWLVTTTDAQRSALAASGYFADRVRAILRATGLSESLVVRARVTAESQETVDRDFEGRWSYAMR